MLNVFLRDTKKRQIVDLQEKFIKESKKPLTPKKAGK